VQCRHGGGRPPTRPTAGPPAHRQRYKRLRQATDASDQNNTGPLCGPVINNLLCDSFVLDNCPPTALVHADKIIPGRRMCRLLSYCGLLIYRQTEHNDRLFRSLTQPSTWYQHVALILVCKISSNRIDKQIKPNANLYSAVYRKRIRGAGAGTRPDRLR